MVREMKFFEKVHKESYMQFITSKISNKKKSTYFWFFNSFIAAAIIGFLAMKE